MNAKAQTTGEFYDEETGKTYKTVIIGKQIWMTQNMDIKTDSNSYIFRSYSETDTSVNNAIYGRLYEWETAQDLCPFGWHLPNKAEWEKLIDHLGGKSVAGGKLKETGTEHWTAPNGGATNESGFTALAGAYRFAKGTYYTIGYDAMFWSSTENGRSNAWSLRINFRSAEAMIFSYNKLNANSVRCIKD